MLHFCCRMVSCSCALFFFFLSESIIGDSMFKPKPKKIVPPDRLYINGSLPNTELDLCTPEKSKRCPTCAARASLWTLRRACEYLHSEAVPGEPELRPALLVGVVSASRWRKVRALQRLCWVGRSVGRWDPRSFSD